MLGITAVLDDTQKRAVERAVELMSGAD